MKKVACALLISVNLISSAFAAKNKATVKALDIATVTTITPAPVTKDVAPSTINAVDNAVEHAIDEVASQTTNQEALDILAWLKERPKTTLALGLASTFLTTDTLYHWLTAKPESTVDEDGVTWMSDEPTMWESMWINKYAITPVKNMPAKCVGYTIALAAAVCATIDLQKEENASYLKQAWAYVASLFDTETTPAPEETTDSENPAA